jgi:hypothetical protein
MQVFAELDQQLVMLNFVTTRNVTIRITADGSSPVRAARFEFYTLADYNPPDENNIDIPFADVL